MPRANQKQNKEPIKKSFIFLWACDSQTGHPYIDAIVEVTPSNKIKNSLKLDDTELQGQLTGLSLRQRFASNTQMALFHVPDTTTPKDLRHYFEHTDRDELLAKLAKAKFQLK